MVKNILAKDCIKRECTSRWNYETGGCDNYFDATDPFNSWSDLGKFKISVLII